MASPDPPTYLLVMTATIRPASNAGVRRADPVLRLEDLKSALRFWLAYPHRAADRILFLENSGEPLDALEAIARDHNPLRKQVEFLSIPGNRIPPGLNYGFTEMELLDLGLAQSQLAKNSTHIIKTTGRLTFPALGPALDRIEFRAARAADPLQLLIDCRKLGFPRKGHDARVQLFVCSIDFYDRFLRDCRLQMNTSNLRLLEQLIYHAIQPARHEPGVHLRFPINIEPVGYSGFKARGYRSPRTLLARAFRAFCRRALPFYWY